MTKMNHHEHLTQKEFKRLVLKYFPEAEFHYFESHFIPVANEWWFKRIILIEKLLESVPLIKPYLSYNCAVIRRSVFKKRIG